MTFDQATRGVHVSNGTGIVAHLGALTAFAEGPDDRLNELVAQLNALANEPWQEIVRSLTAQITATGFEDHPNIACVAVDEQRVSAFVFGETTLSIVIDDRETLLNGGDSSTWIDVVLRGAVERVLAGTQSESSIVGVLRDGVVPAGGFMLDTSGPMPASGRWSEEVRRTQEAAAQIEPDESNIDAVPAPAFEAQEDEPVATTEEAPPVATPEEAAPNAEVPTESLAEPVAPAAPTTKADQGNSRVDEHAPDGGEIDRNESVPEAIASAVGNGVSDARTERRIGMFSRIDERVRNDDEADLPDLETIGLIGDEPPEAPPEEPSAPESVAQTEREPVDEPSPAPTAPSRSASPVPDAPVEEAPQQAATSMMTEARPQIRGLRCENGHLTNPEYSTCITCGIRVDTAAPEEIGDRPLLGLLTFDDGAALHIDRPAAIGSDVTPGYRIDGEAATIVRLDDGIGGIDPVHIEVQISGWHVNIVDMQTIGGTYMILGGERQTRTKLRTGQSATLQPGMTIEAGGRSFTYTVGPTPIPS